MKNAIVAIIAVGVGSFVAHAFADAPAPHFSFKVPRGWTDKSGGRGAYLTLAVDEKDRLAMQARVMPGGAPVTPALVAKYIADAQKSVARILGGGELKVIDARNTTIGGASAVRFLFELPAPPQAEDPQPTRQLQFYIPAGDEHAIITFTAPVKSYDKFVKLFENTAAETVIRK